MEGATGNTERARLLFQRGLTLYPNNLQILNMYACFEEKQGNIELARELHQQALGIDSSSVMSMHNRVSWADLEVRNNDMEAARALLLEGLDAHPSFAAGLLLLAKIERLSGHLVLAEAHVRRVLKVNNGFS
jgi:tetratricopeptide (TPR) repeat protein